MILLIPDNWILENKALDPDLGTLLNTIFVMSYEEKLDVDGSYRLLVKPEGFPYPGSLIEFKNSNERHCQAVIAFHDKADDSVLVSTMFILGFEKTRSAKLTLRPGEAGETSWYALVNLNGVDTAVRTLAELVGLVKPLDKSIH